MSVTGQKVRLHQGQQLTSSNIFPAKVNTETKSCLFVKKLLTVSISNITYLRSIFPEEAYANRSLNGLPLKILMEKNKVPAAATLASWLVGAFDALERKYLKELVLIVYLDESCPEVVHEMYSFKFSYPRGEVSCQMTQGFGDNKAQSVKQDDLFKSTQSLLRTIIDLTQELGPLPSSAFMSMKLMYYDEVTPEDYEPSGFKPSEVKDFQLPPDCLSVNAGEVSTGRHGVKVRVQAQQVQQQDQSIIVTNNYSASASESDTDPRGPATRMMSHPDSSSISQPPCQIICICKNTKPDSLMMTCRYCSTQQHAACYRVTEEERVPTVHCCVDCSIESQGSRKCTDTKLVKMSTKPAVVLTCIFRRALVSLMHKEEVGVDFFIEKFSLGEDLVEGILQKMVKEAIVKVRGDGCYEVDKIVLEQNALPKYLGVRKSHERAVESIVEKASDMNIESMDTTESVKSTNKRRLEESLEDSRINELGRRQSKRIKRSKAVKDVMLAK